MSNPGNDPFVDGALPENPGNNPFPVTGGSSPPVVVSTIQYLTTFGIAAPFLTSGTMAMGTLSAQTLTFPQTPVASMPSGTITKIRTEQNGGAEWTGGTINFRLYKNNVLVWETTPIGTGGYINEPNPIQNQRVRWNYVNIPYVESDFFSADIVTASITGGPEGQMMHLWGVTDP